MKLPFDDTREMKKELRSLKSYWSNESLLNTRMLLWFCEQVEEFLASRKRKKPQKAPLTAWQKFASERLKQGKAMQEIAKEWKAKG
jgi:DNA-binding NarL/FixJ family response regulator